MKFARLPRRSSAGMTTFVGAALALVLATTDATAQTRLNPPLPRGVGGDIQRMQLDSGGARVVYVADQDEDDVFELYVVESTGATRVQLNPPPPADADVAQDFQVSADDAHVVFRADMDVDERFELYTVPIGGGVPRKLNGPIVPGGSVGLVKTAVNFAICPDGTRVVYRARETSRKNELYVVPIDGSAAPLQLSGAQAGRVGRFRLTPDGTRALYQINAPPYHLFSVASRPTARP